jgi:hypothetical protein
MVKTFDRSDRHPTPERFETLESDDEPPKSKRNEIILGVSLWSKLMRYRGW